MNKKKLVGGIAAVLLLGAGVAYGIGGSQSDPLISLEYLKETFQPALLQQIDSKVETSVSASYQKVVEKVTQGSSESSVGLTMKTQHRNDTVTLHSRRTGRCDDRNGIFSGDAYTWAPLPGRGRGNRSCYDVF